MSIQESSPVNSDLAIQTFGLTKLFGKIQAVNGLDLSIQKGELFALLGPNGSGKTTTINMLCCLLKPTSGTASIMGFDINRDPNKIKAIIGNSPQETTLSDHLTPLENLTLIAGLKGIDSTRARKWAIGLIEIMGLTDRIKDQVRKFSGGMKRRLSIAMALISDPEVVFLDEPTLGLDPQARRALWEYIQGFKGIKTILLTTHYMEEADFLADRIGIIDCGKIAALGTASDLKKRVQEKQTIMINALNLTINNLNEIKSRFKDIKVQGACISISGTMLDFKQVTDFVHSTGATIRSAYYKEPSLEDAYLKITGKEFAR